ncbi:hypothetical protein HanPI659440_Chr12g0478991 [Helianthus annuus]|nr:hypothetical protein HanPI659440_Chr12g0478991 [Helianthus annuus]
MCDGQTRESAQANTKNCVINLSFLIDMKKTYMNKKRIRVKLVSIH